MFALFMKTMLLICTIAIIESANLTVMGTGYVGLVTGVCFSNQEHRVVCYDIDSSKIDRLNNGQSPIYEQHLPELIQNGMRTGFLTFTDNLQQALKNTDIVFIAVGTPSNDVGEADLTILISAIESIVDQLDHDILLCIKSTVPPGTNKRVQELVNKRLAVQGKSLTIEVVSNPEFLKQGAAVRDTFFPERIVIGARSMQASSFMRALYNELADDHKLLAHLEQIVPELCAEVKVDRERKTCLFFDMLPEEAETVKYVANTCLAMKIAFANEVAEYCTILGADVNRVLAAVCADQRIGSKNFTPGPGFGGSCFPKDVSALKEVVRKNGLAAPVITSILTSNAQHQKMLAQAIVRKLSLLGSNTVVCGLGLAFKANTDDIRYSPAIAILQEIQHSLGCRVQVYDPQACVPADCFGFYRYHSVDDAVNNADAIIMLTEWPEFRELDWRSLSLHVNRKLIIDLRNVVNPITVHSLGFELYNLDILKELSVL